MKLELISFKLCPFVQRSVITLREKGVDYDITYIDLNNPPDWFKAISPLGKVPLLKVNSDDQQNVLFESAVIAEFIDEITPNPLMPTDPVERAINRAWIAFASDCQDAYFALTNAIDKDALEKASQTLSDRFAQLEAKLGDGPYFNGARMSLVDAAFAPLFMRLDLLSEERPAWDKSAFPAVAAWSDTLLATPSVKNSVVEEFPRLFKGRMLGMDSYAAEYFFEDI